MGVSCGCYITERQLGQPTRSPEQCVRDEHVMEPAKSVRGVDVSQDRGISAAERMGIRIRHIRSARAFDLGYATRGDKT